MGVIAVAEEHPPLPGEPDFTLVTARLASIDRLYPITGFSPEASGTALLPLHARVRACGEAVERYCGFLFSPSPELHLEIRHLPGRAVSPAVWPRCSPREYEMNRLAPPDPRRRYHWVEGWSLTAGERVYVPALQVSLGFVPADPAELTHIPHSTGLAAGETLESATLSGLCEVLERDAFMVTWCKRLPAPRISLPSSRWGEIDERLRRVSRAGLELRLHALLPDRPPAKVLALILGRPGGRVPIATGLGAATEVRAAIAKAIDEAVQSRRAILSSVIHGGMKIPERPEEVRSLPDHLAYYLNPERLTAFDFLESSQTIPVENVPAGDPADTTGTLNRIVTDLSAGGYEVIRVDLTTPDIADAGFRVVRVVVPGLIPLAHGYWVRFLGCPRWREFPGEITPFPHPFG